VSSPPAPPPEANAAPTGNGPEVTPLVSSLPAGPPLFITLSNIYDSDTATSFTVTFDSDQAFVANLQAWAGSIPGQSGNAIATVTDSSAVLHHVLQVTVGAGHAGQVYSFNITVDSSDVSGLTLRPYNGVTQLAGARVPGSQMGASVPVRFFMYGDGTRPAGGGPNHINWSSYTWAQWNPKGTTYPTP